MHKLGSEKKGRGGEEGRRGGGEEGERRGGGGRGGGGGGGEEGRRERGKVPLTLNQDPPWTGSLKWLMLMIQTMIQMTEMTLLKEERERKGRKWRDGGREGGRGKERWWEGGKREGENADLPINHADSMDVLQIVVPLSPSSLPPPLHTAPPITDH